MAHSLKGKTVVVTGASRGIGRDTAFKFAGEGCKLAITYFEEWAEGDATERKCRKLGAEDVLLLHLNLMDSSSIRKTAAAIAKKYGRISILVNNAGWVVQKPFVEQSFEDIERQVRTNLEGSLKLTSLCLPLVDDAILNVASGAGEEGYAELVTYCATKFGVRGFTQALAAERPDLRIYAINPGTTSTRMTNYSGASPTDVAQIILDTAKGKHGTGRGNDVDVWKLL